jgi:hypothetical protein
VSANTLENTCENMLTHVHNVRHLVVSTFDQGWQSWWRGGVVFHWLDSGRVVTGLGVGCVRSVAQRRVASVFVTGLWAKVRPDVQGLRQVTANVCWRKAVHVACEDRTLACVRSGSSGRVQLWKRRSGPSLDSTWLWVARCQVKWAVRPVSAWWHGCARVGLALTRSVLSLVRPVITWTLARANLTVGDL